MNKYEPVILPTRQEAVKMASDRLLWAEDARARDQLGTAREFELTALLLQTYANS